MFTNFAYAERSWTAYIRTKENCFKRARVITMPFVERRHSADLASYIATRRPGFTFPSGCTFIWALSLITNSEHRLSEVNFQEHFELELSISFFIYLYSTLKKIT